MFKDLFLDIKKSFISIIPIYVLILLSWVFKFIYISNFDFLTFSISTIFVIFGVGLFNYGSEVSMRPTGRDIGKALTAQGKSSVLVASVFIFAFLVTIAEPDLNVLSLNLTGIINKWALIISVGISVGLFAIFAVLKIIFKRHISHILSVMYFSIFMLVALTLMLGKGKYIGLAFDSGGVTTGPITVPFMMGLGLGISSVLSKRSEKDAPFGFVAFSSAGPIIALLLLALFSKGSGSSYNVQSQFELSFIHQVFKHLFISAKEAGVLVALIAFCYLVINKFYIKSDKKNVINLLKGLLIAYIGLVIFLCFANVSYMIIGTLVGVSLQNSNKYFVYVFALLIGAFTILAEPAVQILVNQVEEITNNGVKKSQLFAALAIGAALAILVAFLRVDLNIPILYIMIAVYFLSIVLSIFVPSVYTAISFDAGAVASGPLTSSFILPLLLGYSSLNIKNSDDALNLGFGVVGLIASSPILFIEILGVISMIQNQLKMKKGFKRIKNSSKSIIIDFNKANKNSKIVPLYMLFIVVPRGRGAVVEDLLSGHNASFFINTLAHGSGDIHLSRDLVISIVRSDFIKDISLELEDKFRDFNGNKVKSANISMYYSVPLESIAGSMEYLVLTGGGKV